MVKFLYGFLKWSFFQVWEVIKNINKQQIPSGYISRYIPI
jgi:hypothetical protein